MISAPSVNLAHAGANFAIKCQSRTTECVMVHLANESQQCIHCANYMAHNIEDPEYLELENDEVEGLDLEYKMIYGNQTVETSGSPPVSLLPFESTPSKISSAVKFPLRSSKPIETERNEWYCKLGELKEKIEGNTKLSDPRNAPAPKVGSVESEASQSAVTFQHTLESIEETSAGTPDNVADEYRPPGDSDGDDDDNDDDDESGNEDLCYYPWLGSALDLRNIIEHHLQKAKVIDNIKNMELTLEKTGIELQKLNPKVNTDIPSLKLDIDKQLLNLTFMERNLDAAEGFKATIRMHLRLMKMLTVKDISDKTWKKHQNAARTFIKHLECCDALEYPLFNGEIPVMKDLVDAVPEICEQFAVEAEDTEEISFPL